MTPTVHTRLLLVVAIAGLLLAGLPASGQTHEPPPEADCEIDPIFCEFFELQTIQPDIGPGIVYPPADTVVRRLTDVVAFHPDPSIIDVEIVALSLVSSQPITVSLGKDLDSTALTEGPGCAPNECNRDGYWEFQWDVEFNPDGYQLQAFAHREDQEPELFDTQNYLPDFTPEITYPDPWGEIYVATPVQGRIPTHTPEWTWGYYPLPIYPLDTAKGLPLKDQHEDGQDRSGDRDGDGKSGDDSCAPTAAASSLHWFGDNGYPEIMQWSEDLGGGTMTNRNLVNIIGILAGTDNSGTMPADLARAIQIWLDYKLGAGVMEVKYENEVTDPADVATEFNRGQDVLLGLYWNGGGAHRVAVNDVTMNDDGTWDIEIMDPWNGTFQTMTVDSNGNTTYNGGARVMRMIHVSPVDPPALIQPDGFLPLPYPLDPDAALALWNPPGAGDFMLTLSAQGPGGTPSGTDFRIVHVPLGLDLPAPSMGHPPLPGGPIRL